MRKMTLLKTLLIFALVVAVVGFFRGWFTLSSQRRDVDSNKVDVNLTIDPDKVKEDAAKVEKRAIKLTEKAANDAKEPGDRTNGDAKPNEK